MYANQLIQFCFFGMVGILLACGIALKSVSGAKSARRAWHEENRDIGAFGGGTARCTECVTQAHNWLAIKPPATNGLRLLHLKFHRAGARLERQLNHCGE
jgi:hypothetical protein